MGSGIIILDNGEYDIEINTTSEFDSILINALFCLPIYTDDNRENPSIYNLLSASLQQEYIGSKIPILLKHNTITTSAIEQIKEECFTVLRQIQDDNVIDGFAVDVEKINTSLVFRINLYINDENIYREYIYDAMNKNIKLN
jgi:hypothetical protein